MLPLQTLKGGPHGFHKRKESIPNVLPWSGPQHTSSNTRRTSTFRSANAPPSPNNSDEPLYFAYTISNTLSTTTSSIFNSENSLSSTKSVFDVGAEMETLASASDSSDSNVARNNAPAPTPDFFYATPRPIPTPTPATPAQPKYKPFTPLPNIPTKGGAGVDWTSYLDALSGAPPIPGQTLGSSDYLDALSSQPLQSVNISSSPALGEPETGTSASTSASASALGGNTRYLDDASNANSSNDAIIPSEQELADLSPEEAAKVVSEFMAKNDREMMMEMQAIEDEKNEELEALRRQIMEGEKKKTQDDDDQLENGFGMTAEELTAQVEAYEKIVGKLMEGEGLDISEEELMLLGDTIRSGGVGMEDEFEEDVARDDSGNNGDGQEDMLKVEVSENDLLHLVEKIMENEGHEISEEELLENAIRSGDTVAELTAQVEAYEKMVLKMMEEEGLDILERGLVDNSIDGGDAVEELIAQDEASEKMVGETMGEEGLDILEGGLSENIISSGDFSSEPEMQEIAATNSEELLEREDNEDNGVQQEIQNDQISEKALTQDEIKEGGVDLLAVNNSNTNDPQRKGASSNDGKVSKDNVSREKDASFHGMTTVKDGIKADVSISISDFAREESKDDGMRFQNIDVDSSMKRNDDIDALVSTLAAASVQSSSNLVPTVNNDMVAAMLSSLPAKDAAKVVSEYMIKSHEDKIDALRMLEAQKNGEIESLREQMETNDEYAEELQKRVTSLQNYMSQYILESQEEKLRAVKEAESSLEEKFSTVYNALLLRSNSDSDVELDEVRKMFQERKAAAEVVSLLGVSSVESTAVDLDGVGTNADLKAETRAMTRGAASNNNTDILRFDVHRDNAQENIQKENKFSFAIPQPDELKQRGILQMRLRLQQLDNKKKRNVITESNQRSLLVARLQIEEARRTRTVQPSDDAFFVEERDETIDIDVVDDAEQIEEQKIIARLDEEASRFLEDARTAELEYLLEEGRISKEAQQIDTEMLAEAASIAEAELADIALVEEEAKLEKDLAEIERLEEENKIAAESEQRAIRAQEEAVEQATKTERYRRALLSTRLRFKRLDNKKRAAVEELNQRSLLQSHLQAKQKERANADKIRSKETTAEADSLRILSSDKKQELYHRALLRTRLRFKRLDDEKKRAAVEELNQRSLLKSQFRFKRKRAEVNAHIVINTATQEACQVEADERIKVEGEAEGAVRLQIDGNERLRIEAEVEGIARLQVDENERLRLEAEAEQIARLQSEENERLKTEAARLRSKEDDRTRVEAGVRVAARLQVEEDERLRVKAETDEAARLQIEEDERLRLGAEAAILQADEDECLRAEEEVEAEETARLRAEKDRRLRLDAEAKPEKSTILMAEKDERLVIEEGERLNNEILLPVGKVIAQRSIYRFSPRQSSMQSPFAIEKREYFEVKENQSMEPVGDTSYIFRCFDGELDESNESVSPNYTTIGRALYSVNGLHEEDILEEGKGSAWETSCVSALYSMANPSVIAGKGMQLNSGAGTAGILSVIGAGLARGAAATTEKSTPVPEDLTKILLTDSQVNALEKCVENLKAARFPGSKVELGLLDWNKNIPKKMTDNFDFIIGCDCAFLLRTMTPLARTVASTLKSSPHNKSEDTSQKVQGKFLHIGPGNAESYYRLKKRLARRFNMRSRLDEIVLDRLDLVPLVLDSLEEASAQLKDETERKTSGAVEVQNIESSIYSALLSHHGEDYNGSNGDLVFH